MLTSLRTDRLLALAHLSLAALWAVHHMARASGLPRWLADHPPGGSLLLALSFAGLLAAVAGCLWIVWATVRRPDLSSCLRLAALGAAFAVRDPQPDALDVAWLLVVVPLSVLQLEGGQPDAHPAS